VKLPPQRKLWSCVALAVALHDAAYSKIRGPGRVRHQSTIDPRSDRATWTTLVAMGWELEEARLHGPVATRAVSRDHQRRPDASKRQCGSERHASASSGRRGDAAPARSGADTGVRFLGSHQCRELLR
jgi:hypothetical protein